MTRSNGFFALLAVITIGCLSSCTKGITDPPICYARFKCTIDDNILFNKVGMNEEYPASSSTTNTQMVLNFGNGTSAVDYDTTISITINNFTGVGTYQCDNIIVSGLFSVANNSIMFPTTYTYSATFNSGSVIITSATSNNEVCSGTFSCIFSNGITITNGTFNSCQ